MTQQIINVGAVANDGTGESLRTAFEAVNNNFSQIWASGPVNSNVVISNNVISTTPVNTPLILAPGGIGNIQANAHIIPGVSGVYDLGSANNKWDATYSDYYYGNGYFLTGVQAANVSAIVNGNSNVVINGVNGIITVSVNAVPNVATFTTTGFSVAGNIDALGNASANYFIGNGSLLTGIVASGGSSIDNGNSNVRIGGDASNVTVGVSGVGNVAVFTPTGLQVTNTITATNLVASGNVTAARFLGNGASLSSITGANVTGNVPKATYAYTAAQAGLAGVANTVLDAAQPNITSVGILNSLSATGNITGNFFYGNGRYLTGIQGSGGGGTVTFGNIAPGQPTVGDVWIQANTGTQFIYFNDNTSNQWAEMEAYVSYGTTVNQGSNTGNIGFVGDAMYDLNGMIIENADLSHGATAALIIPSNGNSTTPVQLNNTYGNVTVTTGTDPGHLKTWTFDNTGNLSVPSSINFNGGSIYQVADEDLHIIVQDVENDGWSLQLDVTDGSGTHSRIQQTRDQIEFGLGLTTGPTRYWQFSDTGVTNLPGDVWSDYSGNLSVIARGVTDSSFVELATQDNSDIKRSNVTVTRDNVTVSTGSGASNWTFDVNGNLTAPGNITTSATVTGDTGFFNDVIVNNSSTNAILFANGDRAIYNTNWDYDEGTDVISGIGNINTTGNISAGYFIGDGSQLTGLPASYGNTNVATFLAAYGSNTVSTTGNITGGNILTAGLVSATGNVNAGNVVASPGIGTLVLGRATATGSPGLSSTSSLTFVADRTGTPKELTFNTSGDLSAPGIISGASITATGNISAAAATITGNITGNFVAPAATANTQVLFNNAGMVSGVAGFTFDLNGNVLTLAGSSTLKANDIQSNSGALRLISPSSGTRSYGNFLPQFDVTYNLGDSILRWQNFYANISNTITSVTAGNITGGNILTGGLVSATGNVSGNYFIGNGSQLTGLPASYGDSNVVTLLAAFGSNTISTTGNINAGNLNVATGTANVANLYMTAGYIETPVSAGINIVPGGAAGTRVWSKLVPNANVAFSLGSSTEYWANGYIGNVISTTVSATGDITGGNVSGLNLFATNASGDEGGEIQLAKPPNGTLGGGISIDAYQNRARVFEQGGGARGLYFDIANAPSGVGAAVGYLNIPQVSFTGNATITATDAGKHYYSTLSTANVLTIANNTSVGWSVGTAISIVNRGTGNITIAQDTGVSLYLAGNSTASNRTITTYGMATIMNVAANVWMINGTGVV